MRNSINDENLSFTIFTPVFNREKVFSRVFDSVKSQTYRNFEWIIINDGSTDNSDEIITSLISTVDFDVIYIKQENGGKHSAWNKAVSIANGELFLPADCDDSFSSDTLHSFCNIWLNFTSKQRDCLSGINVLCVDEDNVIIGEKYPFDFMITNNLELKYKYKVKGEKWGCIRTDLLKKIIFPIYKNSHYPENFLWFNLSLKYKVVCVNKALRTYFIEETSITHTKVKNKSNIKVYVHYNKWLIRKFGFYILKNDPISYLRSLAYILKYIYIIMFLFFVN